MFNPMVWRLIWQAAGETLYMVGVAVVLAEAIGLPLGIILVTTERGHILENPFVNRVLATIINIGRSIPFIILMVAIIPFTRMLVGTSIGTTAAMVPLTVAAIPFVARLVETALKEVDGGCGSGLGFRRIAISNYLEGTDSRSAALPGFRGDNYSCKSHWLFSHGRGCRRRWLGRPCRSLRIPALPDRYYAGNGHHLDRFSAGNAESGGLGF